MEIPDDAMAQAVAAQIIEDQISEEAKFCVSWGLRYYKAEEAWYSRKLTSILFGRPDPGVDRQRQSLWRYSQEFYSRDYTTTELLIYARRMLDDIDSMKHSLKHHPQVKKFIRFGMLDSLPELERKASYLLKMLRARDPKKYGSAKTQKDLLQLLSQEVNRQERGELVFEIGKVQIYSKDLLTHVHGFGLTRSGKSKLIELICRQLTLKGIGYTLVDPNGPTYWDMLSWLAHEGRRVHLFESSSTDKIVGLDLFSLASKDEAQIMTAAEKKVAATMRAWDMDDLTKAPRLAKWLKRIYYVLIEQGLSIVDVECFLNNSDVGRRNRIIESVRNPSIKESLRQLYKSQTSFAGYLESTENRLEIFTHPQVRRILGLKDNCLDLKGILDNQETLLVNLQSSNIISAENNRVLGTLLINEIWQIVRERKHPIPYYLIIDECQTVLTPDVAEILDQAAKYGLHLMLFHQRESQLDRKLSSALQNAQVKFIFSTDDDPKPQRQFFFKSPTFRQLSKYQRPLREVPFIPDPPNNPQKVAEHRARILENFLAPQEVDEQLSRTNNEVKSHKEELAYEDLLR